MGLVEANMYMLFIIWSILTAFVIGLGFFSLRLYLIDKDKRKLMYGVGLLFSSISFLQLSFGLVKYGTTNYFSDILYHWGATAYMILIFWVVIQQILKEQIKIDLIFYMFLFVNFISFVILASNIITDFLYGFFMGAGSIIVVLISIIFIIKEKNVTSHLFLLSLISNFIASLILVQTEPEDVITSYFSIFAYFTGYSFIALIFMVSPLEVNSKSGIGSFFSIEKQLKTTSKELQNTKRTFENLFDQMVDGVVIVNKKGTVLEASRKFYENINTSREEIIGKNFLFLPFLDAKTKRLLIKNIGLRLTGKKIPPYEITAYTKDGSPIPFEIHAGKIKFNGKSADMAVFRDLRDRKKVEKTLHETEIKYKTIFEKTGIAIGTFGDDGLITMVNSEFEKLSGYSKNEVENHMYWYDFVSENDKKKMFEFHKQRSINNGNPPSEYNSSFIDKNGRDKSVHINIGLIPETSLRIVSLIDITPLKMMQKKLENMNKHLEEKVNQRTEEIQLLLKQKDEFIQQLGHDLKNPLGPLINILPILEKRETDVKNKEMLEVVNRNVRYMKNLVVKTIELAQLNSPNTQFNMKNICLTDIISEVISTNQLLFQDKKIDLVNNIPSNIRINADKLRIQELFENIFNNAIKYTKDNGSIFIDANFANDDVIITIQDSGIGMTKNQIQHIFDEFYKADGSRHDFDSSGLGMSICKRIVEKHDGKIWVESKGLGNGTTFYISLPLEKKNEEYVINEKRSIKEIRDQVDNLI
jgi:PAS domain S-box-containing protein